MVDEFEQGGFAPNVQIGGRATGNAFVRVHPRDAIADEQASGISWLTIRAVKSKRRR